MQGGLSFSKSVFFRVLVMFLLLLFTRDKAPVVEAKIRKIWWGEVFSPVQTSVLNLDCSLNGVPMCCGVMSAKNYTAGSKQKLPKLHHVPKCKVNATYISSPYELRHLNFAAHEILNLSNSLVIRRRSLLKFFNSQSEIDAAKRWLRRVNVHMQSADVPIITSDDHEYLSRFHVTRTCDGVVREWDEWIEPLTLYTRHPFSFSICRFPEVDMAEVYRVNDVTPVSLLSTDYVLLRDGRDATIPSTMPGANANHVHQKKYMFDAGTSRFDSGLFWFICGYFQRGISFDGIFGWEMTLLEPTTFWSFVPHGLKALYHFYNVPVGAKYSDEASVLRTIVEVATPQDFVAFKLDIDHPNIELPIALQLAQESEISNLVDEFFFELHFSSELMTDCGWGFVDEIHPSFGRLDLNSALKYFLELRKQGMRAHIWP